MQSLNETGELTGASTADVKYLSQNLMIWTWPSSTSMLFFFPDVHPTPPPPSVVQHWNIIQYTPRTTARNRTAWFHCVYRRAPVPSCHHVPPSGREYSPLSGPDDDGCQNKTQDLSCFWRRTDVWPCLVGSLPSVGPKATAPCSLPSRLLCTSALFQLFIFLLYFQKHRNHLIKVRETQVQIHSDSMGRAIFCFWFSVLDLFTVSLLSFEFPS